MLRERLHSSSRGVATGVVVVRRILLGGVAFMMLVDGRD